MWIEQVRKYGKTRKAASETIRICKDRRVLAEYLREREKEVIDIMITLFDQEYVMEQYGKNFCRLSVDLCGRVGAVPPSLQV